MLLARGHNEAGAEALRSMFARFSTDTDGEISRLCASAGVWAIDELGSLGRKTEAVELAHAVYARFDGSDDAEIGDQVRWITTAFPREGRAMRLVRRPPRS